MNTSQIFALAVFLSICLGAGGLGSVFTASAVKTWFVTLRKPSWNPPNWLFAPVWTTLYIFMAIGAWLVWRDGQFFGLPGLLFAVQLVLNLAWSWLFFNMKRPDYAFVEIVFLWASIVGTMVLFWQVNSVAGWLYVPYILWVTFASMLNLAIWRLNPHRQEVGTGGHQSH